MITGHGYDFVGAGLRRGYLPPQAPRSMLFETWTDLGLVGAAAAAVLIRLAYKAAAEQSRRLAPFWIGALTYVSVMGLLGLATTRRGGSPCWRWPRRLRLRDARRLQDGAAQRAQMRPARARLQGRISSAFSLGRHRRAPLGLTTIGRSISTGWAAIAAKIASSDKAGIVEAQFRVRRRFLPQNVADLQPGARQNLFQFGAARRMF